MISLWHLMPTSRRSFSGPRSRAAHLLTIYCSQHNQALKPRLVESYRTASSTDAVTRLSYPLTHRAFAQWCRILQISPQIPVALRRPQKPTCPVCVVPSRAPHSKDLHLIFAVQGLSALLQIPFPCRPTSGKLKLEKEKSD
jgi:hypothetical protein